MTMRRQRLFVLLPTLIALSLLAVLLLTTPAYAQDEQPPDPEEVPVEAVVDSPAVEEAPEAELAPTLEVAAEAGVTLADGSGEPLALASEEAAEALAGGDPYFKVGTVTYHFLKTDGDCSPYPLGTCWTSATPINAAIAFIPTIGLPSDGLIYVEAGTYSDFITVDASAPGSIYKGLKGVVGSVADGAPTVNLSNNIYVTYVNLGFTLKGFNVTVNTGTPAVNIVNSLGTVKIEDVAVTNSNGSGSGLSITGHNGAVILNRVKVNDNQGGGAVIDNTNGSAGVTITNSSFDANKFTSSGGMSGLYIATRGALLIDGVSASRNLNGRHGLYIYKSGAVTIKNSVFNDNTEHGILNDYGNIPTGTLTLNNVYAQDNASNGIQLYNKGNIVLSGVHADGNYVGGIFDNCLQSAGACSWLGSGTVTITDSTFDHNTANDHSLQVRARGAITLTGVSASWNTSGYGARLDTSLSQLASAVTVNSSFFNLNGFDGLGIYAKGAVTLNKVHAGDYDPLTSALRGNSGNGALIDNTYGTAGVTIKGTTYGDNQFSYNDWIGIVINTKGAITAQYLEASANDQNGAWLDNSLGTAGVTMKGGLNANKFNNNGTVGGYPGLEIISDGAISLSGVSSSGNGNGGVWANNIASTGNVSITDGFFNSNLGSSGLSIDTKGTITLTRVEAYDNANDGVTLNNSYSGATPKGVTINGGIFANNASDGIDVISVGPIKITNAAADSNSREGMILRNDSALIPQAVTLTNIEASDNSWDGLKALTDGAITISGATTSDNDYYGMVLYDWPVGIIPTKVTISNAEISRNSSVSGYDNLRILTTGSVVLSNVNANGCLTDCNGVMMGEEQSIGGSVTITKSKFNTNKYYGLWVTALGKLTLSGIQASYNGDSGAELYNDVGLPALPTATISNSEFVDNDAFGLRLTAAGAVTLTNIWAGYNDNDGAYIKNTTGNVTLLSSGGFYNGFSYNVGGEGLLIDTAGAVILNKLSAYNNTNGYGAYIFHSGGFAGNVTIKTGQFNRNGNSGLYVDSGGVISVNGIEASFQLNPSYGAYLVNTHDTTGTKGVTVTKSTFNGNTLDGLYVDSYGVITINNITALSNTQFGANLQNNAGSAGINILGTLGANTFNSNASGLYINTKGNVLANDITADNNWYGIYLQTSSGTVTLNRVKTRFNSASGFVVLAHNTVTLNSVISSFNNVGTEIISEGFKVTISNSMFISNRYQGIYLDILPGGNYTLTNTYYFGNDTIGGGWLNLEIQ
jgi:hypothetical protein